MLAVLDTTASAQELTATLSVVEPSAPTETLPYPPPYFELTIRGATSELTRRHVALIQSDREPPVAIPAAKVQRYQESDRKLAMVILLQGTGRWMGTEHFAEEENREPSAGAFPGLDPALKELARAGPPGSQAAVMVYGDNSARLLYGMDDIRALRDADVLGIQKSYDHIVDAPLLVGLTQATLLLNQFPDHRRVLVVIGDGHGKRDDITQDLQKQSDALRKRHIEVYTIYYGRTVPDADTGWANMKALASMSSFNADSRSSFDEYARSIVLDINHEYRVVFPLCSTQPPERCYSSDGQVHAFIPKIHGRQRKELELETPLYRAFERSAPRKLGGFMWSVVIIFLALTAAVIVIRQRR